MMRFIQLALPILPKKSNGPHLPLNVAANQRLTEVSIAMTPSGAVSGRISDTNGEPIPADVFALKSSWQEVANGVTRQPPGPPRQVP
jgi:hypothetical protein